MQAAQQGAAQRAGVAAARHVPPRRGRPRCAGRRRAVRHAARRGAGGGGPEDELLKQLGRLADKYVLGSSSSAGRRASSSQRLPVQALHVLLAVLLLAWLATGVRPPGGGQPLLPAKLLALDGGAARWWAPLTDAFVSPSGGLLARNCFFTYVFGRVVQNTQSGAALWLTYLLGAAGGSAAGLLLLPRRAPLQGCGASGAAFALFAAATLLNPAKTWHWHRAVELAALLPFVVQQLLAGHAGLSQWCVLAGLRLPGAWVPLLGGLAGAGAAAALLALVQALARGAAAQAPPPPQAQPGGPGDAVAPLPALLAQLLRRALGV